MAPSIDPPGSTERLHCCPGGRAQLALTSLNPAFRGRGIYHKDIEVLLGREVGAGPENNINFVLWKQTWVPAASRGSQCEWNKGACGMCLERGRGEKLLACPEYLPCVLVALIHSILVETLSFSSRKRNVGFTNVKVFTQLCATIH